MEHNTLAGPSSTNQCHAEKNYKNENGRAPWKTGGQISQWDAAKKQKNFAMCWLSLYALVKSMDF